MLNTIVETTTTSTKTDHFRCSNAFSLHSTHLVSCYFVMKFELATIQTDLSANSITNKCYNNKSNWNLNNNNNKNTNQNIYLSTFRLNSFRLLYSSKMVGDSFFFVIFCRLLRLLDSFGILYTHKNDFWCNLYIFVVVVDL